MVLIDSGHGRGNVNGSPDGLLIEWRAVREIARFLCCELTRRNIPHVWMNRNTDEDTPLIERAHQANARPDVDVIISIHTNAAPTAGWSSARGLECCIYQKSGYGAKLCASLIGVHAKQSGLPLHGNALVLGNYLLCKRTTAPCVIVECGFHTNKEDTKRLLYEPETYARVIADGVEHYLFNTLRGN